MVRNKYLEMAKSGNKAYKQIFWSIATNLGSNVQFERIYRLVFYVQKSLDKILRRKLEADTIIFGSFCSVSSTTKNSPTNYY